MTVIVRFFGAARELVGAADVSLDLPTSATIVEVKTLLSARYASLSGLLSRSAIARNYEYAHDSDVIAPGDELAVIPPVSGG